MKDLYELIDSAIDDEPPISSRDGDIIKAGFNEEILRLENLGLDGAPVCTVTPAALNAYTEYIYQESVRAWKALEDKYWVQFGSGF